MQSREFPPFCFSGVNIHNKQYGSFLDQTTSAIAMIELSIDASFGDFRTTRQNIAWLSHTRLQILARVNILSQAIRDKYKIEKSKISNKFKQHIRKTPNDGLKFKKLDLTTMIIVVYSDDLFIFSNNNNVSVQVGYQIFLADKHNDANIIDFTSVCQDEWGDMP